MRPSFRNFSPLLYYAASRARLNRLCWEEGARVNWKKALSVTGENLCRKLPLNVSLQCFKTAVKGYILTWKTIRIQQGFFLNAAEGRWLRKDSWMGWENGPLPDDNNDSFILMAYTQCSEPYSSIVIIVLIGKPLVVFCCIFFHTKFRYKEPMPESLKQLTQFLLRLPKTKVRFQRVFL